MRGAIIKPWIGFLSSFLLLASLGSGEVWAQGSGSVAQLNQRLESLERTNQKNNQDVARAMNLLTDIQRQFQTIKGEVDSSRFLRQENDRVYQDLDLRVSGVEDKIDQIHRLLKELVEKSGSADNSASLSPQQQDFDSLLMMVNARDYRSAASGFLGFLRKYPNSPEAPRAQYWVGECFYSMGDFAKAIKEFQKLVSKYPDHPRVKEAIYKQGSAFMRLKKNEEAKLFFQKVMANYPNTAEAAKSQARLHRIQALEQDQMAMAPEESSAKTPIAKPTTPATPTEPLPPPQGTPQGSRPSSSGGTPLF